MEPSPQQPKKNEVEEVGNIFGIVLIVVLLIAGGVYMAFAGYQKMQQDRQQLEGQAQS